MLIESQSGVYHLIVRLGARDHVQKVSKRTPSPRWHFLPFPLIFLCLFSVKIFSDPFGLFPGHRDWTGQHLTTQIQAFRQNQLATIWGGMRSAHEVGQIMAWPLPHILHSPFCFPNVFCSLLEHLFPLFFFLKWSTNAGGFLSSEISFSCEARLFFNLEDPPGPPKERGVGRWVWGRSLRRSAFSSTHSPTHPYERCILMNVLLSIFVPIIVIVPVWLSRVCLTLSKAAP